MKIDPQHLWKAPTPGYVVVFDGEFEYDTVAHARYQAAERFAPDHARAMLPREATNDPRITPRWPCHRLTTLSWLVMTSSDDGLRPLRLETRGRPEQDEQAILAAFFTDMSRLGERIELVSWGGFFTDMPQMLLAAMLHGLQLPSALANLRSPWRRDRSGHLDLMTEIAGGAASPHLAEVAARLGIPAKTVCRPDLVSRLMEQGKWSSVRAVCEGDVFTTAMILMAWRHLGGAGVAALEATRRLSSFIAETCAHRPYAADWKRFGDQAVQAAFSREMGRLASLAPHLGP